MARDKFRDAAGKLETYEWAIGHEEEEPDVKSINLERTAVTSGVGYVRQQGTPSPTTKTLKGWIVLKDQLEKMEAYFDACAGVGTEARTIFWTDISGTEYEVIITEFRPQRKIGRAGGTGLGYVWQYSITMEIV